MSCKNLVSGKAFTLITLLLCLCFLPTKVHAAIQQSSTYKVTGTVKDALGESVIGASVMEKATTNGTITDIDGNFSLNVNPNSTLVISFIGYATQEFTVNLKSATYRV
mgnify:FL=1